MNGTHFRELPDASRNEERRTCHARVGTEDGKFITPDHASDSGSIAIADKAGLLARNTFCRPSHSIAGTVGNARQKLMRYLQLRDSS